MTKTLMVACDGSEPSIRAAHYAAALAKDGGYQVELFTVLQMAVFDASAEFGIPEERLKAVGDRQAEEIFAPIREGWPEGVTRIETPGAGNNIVEVMLKHIEENEPYMVVLGRTGKSAFQRLLEGSVSRGLSELAPCPVCVVS